MNHYIISYYFIGYLLVYILAHFPLDILMYMKKKSIKYPNPQFRNFLVGFFFVIPSISFWVCISIFPYLSLFQDLNLFTINYINFNSVFVFQVIGFIILSLGLVIGCLGRIGRSLYLSKDQPELRTAWGHKIVRHPSYLHYITGFIGLPLVTLNVFYLLFLLGIPAYISVSLTEDKALEEYFGKEFTNYKKKVGLLFPKIRKK